MASHSDQEDGGFEHAKPAGPIDVSVIIVSWNVRDLLRACLKSVAAGRGGLALETIVVDSASSDGTAEMLANEFPWVQLIACTENVGFPRGNNLGLTRASGRHVLLLNPDTEVVGNALPRMAAYLDDHPEVGAIGPQLLNPDGTIQSSRRRFPTLATGIFESTWMAPLAPPSVRRHYYAEDLADQAIGEVDWLTGACLMVPRAVAEHVGPLDEGYFMYSEELDWCRRIKAAGWKVVYYPEAQVVHHLAKSSEQVATERHIYFQRAKLRYFRKYHGRAAAGFLRVILLLNYAWQLVLEAAKGLVGHKRPLRRQRVRAYWRVLRTGLPPAGYEREARP